MMRNRWPGYAVAVLLVFMIAAAGAFAPQALLSRNERALLDKVKYTDYGNYPNRTARPTASPSPTPAPTPTPSEEPSAPADQTESIYRKLSIFDRNIDSRELPVTPPYDMDMKEAWSRCTGLIRDYMKAGAIPPLPNFPDEYPQLFASLRSVDDPGGGESFDYWSISFSSDPSQKRRTGSISVLMDARTGDIYSIKMYTTSALKAFSIEDAARYFADALRLPGVVKPMQNDTAGNQSAVLISKEKTLFISFYYNVSSGGSSFTMACSTRPPG